MISALEPYVQSLVDFIAPSIDAEIAGDKANFDLVAVEATFLLLCRMRYTGAMRQVPAHTPLRIEIPRVHRGRIAGSFWTAQVVRPGCVGEGLLCVLSHDLPMG